jgi:hypothetical protein
VDKIEALRQRIITLHKDGMNPNAIERVISPLVAQHGLDISPWNFTQDTLKEFRREDAERRRREEEQAAEDNPPLTVDLPKGERFQRIMEFLEGKDAWYTRSQLEIGAGYRDPDIQLPPAEYERLKRKIQRDIKDLIDRDWIEMRIKTNPQHRRGQNDDIVLYRAIPAEDDTPQFPTHLRKFLVDTLAAFDARDLDGVNKNLDLFLNVWDTPSK